MGFFLLELILGTSLSIREQRHSKIWRNAKMVGHQNVSCPYNLRRRTQRQVLVKSSARHASMSPGSIHHSVREGPFHPSRGINELPNEVLAVLLRNLTSNAFLNARAVCKRWRSLTDYVVRTSESPLRNRRIVLQTTYEYNWHIEAVKEFASNLGTPFPSASVKIFGYPSILSNDGPHTPFETNFRPIQRKFFSVCGQYIQHLNLADSELSQHDLAIIMSSTPFLKSICLVLRWIDDGNMNHNCINCLDPVKTMCLQKLEVNVHYNSAIWEDSDNLEITTPELTQLKTSYLSCIEFLAHFLRKCGGRQVKHLSLNGCNLFQVALLVLEANRKIRGNHDHANVNHLSPGGRSCIMDLFNADIRFPNLNSLSLQIGEELVKTICNFRIPLRALSLTLSGPNFGGEHLLEMGKFGGLRHLTLDFTNCDQRNFEKDDFRNFRMHLPVLESLKLVYYSGFLDFIMSFEKTLTSLEINTHNEKLRYLLLARQSKFYEKLPKLRKISLLL